MVSSRRNPALLKGGQLNSPESFCRTVLPEVSRTFALNIPVLPEPLDLVVTVAYLLCRIADTLEDETQGQAASRRPLFAELARLCTLPSDWKKASERFAEVGQQRLRSGAPQEEVRLLRGTPVVLAAFAGLGAWTRPHIVRCLQKMTQGMSDVMQHQEDSHHALGLADLDQTITYCYYVAGTVGEMLTGLFANFSGPIQSHYGELMPRAAAFGRALQLTNILKDVREDLERGSCWLPRREMAKHGLTAETLLTQSHRQQAVAFLDEMVGVAQGEADVALEYTLAIPSQERGIRLFCLWPLFFAVLTLRELKGNPAVFEPKPVKITRDRVQYVMMATQELARQDKELRALYASCTNGLTQ